MTAEALQLEIFLRSFTDSKKTTVNFIFLKCVFFSLIYSLSLFFFFLKEVCLCLELERRRSLLGTIGAADLILRWLLDRHDLIYKFGLFLKET